MWGLRFELSLTRSSQNILSSLPWCRNSDHSPIADVPQLSRLAVQVGTVAAQEVVVSFGLKCGIERAHGRYRAELVAELMNAMHDPDKEVALWLRGHYTRRHTSSHRPFGGLPNCVSDQSPAGIITVLLPDPGEGRVYHSELPPRLRNTLRKPARNSSGWLAEAILKEVGSWEDVVARWPDARPARTAVSVTLKSDGTKKVRFILDALRNGTNGLIQVQERIVLPRAHDGP